MPPYQGVETFCGDGRCVQIFFKFIGGCVSAKVVQCIEQIIARRTLILVSDKYKSLDMKYNKTKHTEFEENCENGSNLVSLLGL